MAQDETPQNGAGAGGVDLYPGEVSQEGQQFIYHPDGQECVAGASCVVADGQPLDVACSKCGAPCHTHCAPLVNFKAGSCTAGCNKPEASDEEAGEKACCKGGA